jgi:hypothetical protein
MSFTSILLTSTGPVVAQTDAAFGLWPLAKSWRTFPGARLTNGQGLKVVARFDVV